MNRERNNTKNKDKKIENNLNNIMKNFRFKGRSRNIGIDYEDENQNELTYVPKISFKNNLSVKKEEKSQGKSLNAYKTNNNKSNYLKIYRNIKDRININNYKSNKKMKFSNKHKKNKLNQIKIGKYSDKHILTRNTNQNNISKPNKLLTTNKTLNQENNNFNNICDIQKSFQTQIKEIKIHNNKKLNLDNIIINSNSNKKGLVITKSNKNKSKIINKKNLNLYLKKNENNNNRNHEDKGKAGNSFSCNTKNNLKKINQKIISTPLEYLLNSYKSKNTKYSPEISQNILGVLRSGNNKNNSSHKVNSINKKNKDKKISIDKYIPVKLNKHLDVFEPKGIISISIDNNNKNNYFNNKKGEKNKINKKNNFITQSSFNNNKTFPNISIDHADKSNENINKKKNSKNSKENLNYLLNKKEKSRNKINNFLFNNISSVNYTENKNINTLNNNNNEHIKINNTQQNDIYFKYNNREIIKNKTFINLKKNKNDRKHKKILINFPSSSIKKNGFLSQLDHNSLFNYYSTSFIGKNNRKNRINKSNFNKLLINKSKQRLNLAKECIIKSKNKESIFLKNKKKNNLTGSKDNNNNSNQNNNISKISKLKNNIKNNSMIIKNTITDKQNEFRKYQSLIQKKDSNINIRININNNNIIYNKIVNNKSNNNSNHNNKINTEKNIIDVEIQKINKSPSFNKAKNIPKFLNKNITTNNLKKKNMQKLNNNKLNFIIQVDNSGCSR